MSNLKIPFVVIIIVFTQCLIACKCNDQSSDEDGFIWSEHVSGLSLSVKVEQSIVQMKLKNVSDKQIIIYSHVLSEVIHYDWFLIKLYPADADFRNSETRYLTLHLLGDREKSAPVTDTLQPGEFVQHQINIYDWIGINFNQINISESTYQLVLNYENRHCTDCKEEYKRIWTGYIETPPVKIELYSPEVVELHLRIKSALPIGWGVKYMAEVIEAQMVKNLFGKTILFSLLAGEKEIPVDTELILILRNTGAFANENSHACSCIISSDKEIWEITDVRVFIDTPEKN